MPESRLKEVLADFILPKANPEEIKQVYFTIKDTLNANNLYFKTYNSMRKGKRKLKKVR